MLASRTLLPDLQHEAADDRRRRPRWSARSSCRSSSRSRRRSTRRPQASSSTALVTVTSSRSFSFAQSSSKRVRIRNRAGIRCFSASSSRKLTSSGFAAVDRLRDPVPLLVRGEVGAEEEDLQVAVVVRPRRRTRRAAPAPRRACPSPWRRRTAPRCRPGRSPPSGSSLELLRVAGQGARSRPRRAPPRRAASGRRGRATCGSPSPSPARSDRRPPCGSARASASSRPRCPCGAAATSSSRLARPSSVASALALSPVRLARATMSSACSRASLRRSRYSASSSSASSRCRSRLLDVLRRSSRRAPRARREICGNANFAAARAS